MFFDLKLNDASFQFMPESHAGGFLQIRVLLENIFSVFPRRIEQPGIPYGVSVPKSGESSLAPSIQFSRTSDLKVCLCYLDSVSGFDFTLGGGVKYFFNELDLPWLGFRFDFRYHFITNGLAFAGNDVSPRHNEFTFGGVLRPF